MATKQSWLWGVLASVVVAACGDATVDSLDDAMPDAGKTLETAGNPSVYMPVDAGSAGNAGSAPDAAAQGGSGSGAGSPAIAGTGGTAAAGTGGSAGSGAAAGASGSAGSGVAGASGGWAGAGGSAGGGGAGGSSTPYACPLGANDADANGYPDACETVLATVEFDNNATGITAAPTTMATASYYVLARALSPADSASYPDCNPDVNAVGQQYPVHPGMPETRIFDVRTSPELEHFIKCEKTFLAKPNGVSKLSGLWTKLLFNVHSDWPHDSTGTGSNYYLNTTINATLTPTFTIVYAKRQVTAYNPASKTNPAVMYPNFTGRWTLHGYRTPK